MNNDVYDQPGTSYENTRTDHYNEDLIQIDEPTGRAVYGDKVAAGLVAPQAILSDLRPDLRRSFTHLVTAIASRFQPSNQAELYRAQMKSTTRGKSQSLPKLAQDITKLTRLAYPTAPMKVHEQQRPDKIYKGVQLKLANGEMITTFGQADFDIEINGHKFQQRFVIADINAPAIVGYNFFV
ncbi:unnamed protein product [Mytilus edulis]|uniref:Uncharacterized protein n=1 Tax=Mytilus edulis TaxID=6550 RepID=A0A8S3S6D7_MYTED|nr:unnamed protein product [Mytilus edulis]